METKNKNKKPKTHPQKHTNRTRGIMVFYSKNSQLNLGWTELLLVAGFDVDGTNPGVESNVSHIVVTTTGPDVECLDACCCCGGC